MADLRVPMLNSPPVPLLDRSLGIVFTSLFVDLEWLSRSPAFLPVAGFDYDLTHFRSTVILDVGSEFIQMCFSLFEAARHEG